MASASGYPLVAPLAVGIVMLRQGARQLCYGLTQQGATSWQQLRGLKRSTYLTGLAVDPYADKHTVEQLNAVLEKAKELPVDSGYRKHVETYCQNFLKAVSGAESQEAAETFLGKQYEEVLEDCRNELALMDRMLAWKPWDVPAGHETRLFADIKDIPSNVRLFREHQTEVAAKQ